MMKHVFRLKRNSQSSIDRYSTTERGGRECIDDALYQSFREQMNMFSAGSENLGIHFTSEFLSRLSLLLYGKAHHQSGVTLVIESLLQYWDDDDEADWNICYSIFSYFHSGIVDASSLSSLHSIKDSEDHTDAIGITLLHLRLIIIDENTQSAVPLLTQHSIKKKLTIWLFRWISIDRRRQQQDLASEECRPYTLLFFSSLWRNQSMARFCASPTACSPILTIPSHSGIVLMGRAFWNSVQQRWFGHKKIWCVLGMVWTNPLWEKTKTASVLSLSVVTPSTTGTIFTATTAIPSTSWTRWFEQTLAEDLGGEVIWSKDSLTF